jgi:hypothetical protein
MNPFHWLDSDGRFAIFVDELAKRGSIDDNNKFKIFTKHFLNNRNERFKDLAQKRSFTENTTRTGGFIRNILDKIILTILLLNFSPLGGFIQLYVD